MSNSKISGEFWIFGVICLLIVLFTRKMGDITSSATIGYLTLFTAVWMSGSIFTWVSRYNLGHVVADDFSGSIGDDCVYQVGDFFVFNTGYSLFPMPNKGKLATLVVLKNSCMKIGRNYISNTFVRRIPIDNLPRNICIFIKRYKDKFSQDNIYFGMYSRGFLFNNDTLPEFEMEVENLNRVINQSKALIEDKDDIVIDKVNAARKISDTEGGLQKMKAFVEKRLKRDEE